MISSGTLLAALPPDRVEPACSALSQAGIPFSVVGEVVEGTGLKLSQGDKVTGYSSVQPEDDELARIWELYSPDTRD
jgi:hydrogenase maturation factor